MTDQTKRDPGERLFPTSNRTLGLEEPVRRLSTIREAAVALAEHGITHQQIRRWIHEGASGKRLPTHHVPPHPDATLVDINEVLGFYRRLREGRIRGPGKPHPKRTSFNIRPERSETFQALAAAYSRKLGVANITVADAVWMAVQNELRRMT